jgi:hypothetical protein
MVIDANYGGVGDIGVFKEKIFEFCFSQIKSSGRNPHATTPKKDVFLTHQLGRPAGFRTRC